MSNDDYPYTRGTRRLSAEEMPAAQPSVPSVPSLPAAIGQGLGWGINQFLAGLFTALTAPRPQLNEPVWTEEDKAAVWEARQRGFGQVERYGGESRFTDADDAYRTLQWATGPLRDQALAYLHGYVEGAQDILDVVQPMLPPPNAVIIPLPPPGQAIEVTIRHYRLPPPWEL